MNGVKLREKNSLSATFFVKIWLEKPWRSKRETCEVNTWFGPHPSTQASDHSGQPCEGGASWAGPLLITVVGELEQPALIELQHVVAVLSNLQGVGALTKNMVLYHNLNEIVTH